MGPNAATPETCLWGLWQAHGGGVGVGGEVKRRRRVVLAPTTPGTAHSQAWSQGLNQADKSVVVAMSAAVAVTVTMMVGSESQG